MTPLSHYLAATGYMFIRPEMIESLLSHTIIRWFFMITFDWPLNKISVSCRPVSSFSSTSCGLYKQRYCALFFNSHVEDTTNVMVLKITDQSISVLSNGNRTESNSVCNHTSDNKIGRPRSGNPICLSREWLQTELDSTQSYYQLIIKITISEKRKIAKLCDKGKNLI